MPEYVGLKMIHLCVIGKFQEIIFEKLCKYKDGISSIDTNGNTLAHICVLADKLDLLKYLYQKYKILLNEQNNDGKTALTLAIS